MLKIKESSLFGRRLYYMLLIIRSYFNPDRWISDRKFIDKCYYMRFGFKPNIESPKRLTEYLQYLKLNDRKDIYTQLVDKFAVREYLEKRFGSQHLIPLIYYSDNAYNLDPKNINSFPCIIKSNHDSGFFKIIYNPNDVNWDELQVDFDYHLKCNYYTFSREWPYKNINPRMVVVEKLLQTKEGKLPNDYKLHYINGKLVFVYVSYDRQGVNDRCMFDENWNRLPYLWIPKETYKNTMNTSEVPCPKSFELMKKYASEIAQDFKYVRVDFYDVDGFLYFGEITLYHGSGYDTFIPDEYDEFFGSMIKGNN